MLRHKISVLRSIRPVREGGHRGWAQPRTLQTHLHTLLSTCCCTWSFKWSHSSLHFFGEKVYALMEWIYLGIQKLKIVRIYCTILLPISYTLITVNILFFFFFLLLDLIQHGTFISNRLCLKWILSDNKRQFTRLDDQSPYFQFFLIFNFTLKCYIFSTFLLKVSACGFHHVTSHLQWPSLITGRSPASPAFHWGPLQSF